MADNSELIFTAIGINRLRMLIDGEGVTTLVAGKSCPLRCKYCLNPHCFTDGYKTKKYTVDELIEETSIDSLYFQATGGGITFGGGEPLLQSDFIHEFKEKCPDSWNLYLESSLNVPTAELEKVVTDIDYFFIDIKDMNPDIYLKYTGKDNANVLANLKLLLSVAGPDMVTVRIPLIADYNTVEDQTESKRILEEMGFVNFDLFEYVKDVSKLK